MEEEVLAAREAEVTSLQQRLLILQLEV